MAFGLRLALLFVKKLRPVLASKGPTIDRSNTYAARPSHTPRHMGFSPPMGTRNGLAYCRPQHRLVAPCAAFSPPSATVVTALSLFEATASPLWVLSYHAPACGAVVPSLPETIIPSPGPAPCVASRLPDAIGCPQVQCHHFGAVGSGWVHIWVVGVQATWSERGVGEGGREHAGMVRLQE
ncbi:hypothetical protein BD779DRAFT_1700588 [Infundibulicybe gibba]|nr:hypothetical protein BD779DRAFT_1700588 [Infundibulicybe gibba]